MAVQKKMLHFSGIRDVLKETLGGLFKKNNRSNKKKRN